MKAVAAGDKVALKAAVFAIVDKRDRRSIAFCLINGDIADAINRRCPACLPRRHQIPRHFGLAIHHHAFACRQFRQRNRYALALKQEFDAVMDQPFRIHSPPRPGFAQQFYRSAFQNSRADPPQHILRRLSLKDDGLNPGVM